MARKRDNGVDSWTSNGRGIIGAPLTEAQKKAVEEVKKELAANKNKTQPKKKK